MQRVFLWPLLGMQAATLVPLLAILSGGGPLHLPSFLLVSLALNFANTFLGTYALCWLGMRFGPGAPSPILAIVWSAGLAQGVPWLLTLALGWIPCLPDLAILLFYLLLLIASTKQRLQRMLADGIATPRQTVSVGQ